MPVRESKTVAELETDDRGAAPAAKAGALALEFRKKKKSKVQVYVPPRVPVPVDDTHAHLTCFWRKDPAEVVARAALAGVERLVTLYDPVADDFDPQGFRARLDAVLERAGELLACAAADGEPADAAPSGRPAGAANALELPGRVRYLVGVHPYGAPGYDDAVHARLAEALGDPRCIGVGEIGLDYHFDADDGIEAAPHDIQIACMERQLAFALERGLPVELHLRNDDGDEGRAAHADAYRVLADQGVPEAGCVLHCFTEDRPTMERFVGLGCSIAFGGAATFKRNEAIREAFAACPLDRILFETDCPYMAPDPIRGLECEPAMIAFTVDALCRDRAARTGEEPLEIARAAWENALRLFG